MYDLFVRIIADYIVFVIVAIAAIMLIVYIPKGQRFNAYARILMAGLTGLLIAKFLSVTWQPEAARPYILMGIDPGGSVLDNLGFPSDHSLFVVTIALAVWMETRKKAVSIVLAVMAALVLLGRVLAFVHTPLDVFAGAAIACVAALWYFQRDNEGISQPKKA